MMGVDYPMKTNSKLERSGPLAVLATLLIAVGCPNPDNTVTEDAGTVEETTTVDPGMIEPDIPAPAEPMACGIGLLPAPGWHGPTATLDIWTEPGADQHPVGNVQAAIGVGPCDAPKPDCVITDVPLDDLGEQTFTEGEGEGATERTIHSWRLTNWNPATVPAECAHEPNGGDRLDPKSGRYCLYLSADVEPTAPDPSWGTVQCQTSHTFEIDADGPNFIRVKPVGIGETGNEVTPVDGWGVYFEKMPVELLVYDRSEIESIKLMRGDVELAEFELTDSEEWPGIFDVVTDVDICGLGTGFEDLEIVARDEHGNIWQEAFQIKTAWCPRFQTTHATEPDDGQAPTWIDTVNLDGDAAGTLEVIGATPSGLVTWTNQDGTLVSQGVLPGIDAPVRFAVPVNLDGEGPIDFIVGHAGQDGGYVSAYVWSCLPDLSVFDEMTDDERRAWFETNGEQCPECVEQYVEIERHDVPGDLTTFLWADLAKGTGDQGNLPDLIVGTNTSNKAVGAFLRRGGSSCRHYPAEYTVDLSSPNPEEHKLCKPQWFGAGGQPRKEAPPVACLDTPKSWIAASTQTGGVSTIALENFYTASDVSDLAIGFTTGQGIDLIEHLGDGNFTAAEHIPGFPGPVSQLFPNDHNGDDLVDLIAVLRDDSEIWQVYAQDGGKPWADFADDALPPEIRRRASCVEGKPASVAVAFLDEAGQDPLPASTRIDLVVANAEAGTIWTMRGKQGAIDTTGLKPGLFFELYSVVDGLPDLVQLKLAKMNDDEYWDAVMLNAEGRVALIMGSNPTLSADQDGFGVVGTFRGAENITTPIPAQKLANKCDETSETAISGTSLGLPLDRLEPRFMVLSDFDNKLFSDQAYNELLVVTERSPFVGGFENDVGMVGQPLLYYAASQEPLTTEPQPPYYPRHYLNQKKDVLPYTAVCWENGELGGGIDPAFCPAAFEKEKGATTAVIADKLDFGAQVDVAIATDTFYATLEPAEGEPPCGQECRLPTVDLIWNGGNYQSAQHSKPVLPPVPDGRYALGITPGSRAVSLDTVRCTSGSTIPALAVVTELSSDEFKVTQLVVMTTQGAQTFVERGVYTFPEGVTGAEVQTARLGPNGGETADFPDLLVATNIGVQVYRGFNGNCDFQKKSLVDTGSGFRGMAFADFNQDGYADLVVTQSSGDITLLPGKDGESFEPATLGAELYVETQTLTRPTLADINGDGNLDILALDGSKARLNAFLGFGGFDFLAEPTAIAVAPATNQVISYDFNRDNCAELLTLSRASKAVSLLPNLGPRPLDGFQGACLPLPTGVLPE